jgi:hypothetical protein
VEVDDELYSTLSSLQHTPSASPLNGAPHTRIPPPSGAAAADSSRQVMFVIGRPPGHHAGPNGSVPFQHDSLTHLRCGRCVPSNHYWLRPDMASSGFCLLNTVAVAAVCVDSPLRSSVTIGLHSIQLQSSDLTQPHLRQRTLSRLSSPPRGDRRYRCPSW